MNGLSKKKDLEMNQIKSLLSDFQKAKHKCLELCDKLQKQLPRQQFYETFYRSAVKKVEVLDMKGLIQLKNQLSKNIEELYNNQRELTYELEKNSFRKRYKQIELKPKEPSIIESLSLQIPSYRRQQEQNDQKIERISNFIQQLRKSMVSLNNSLRKNWNEQYISLYEPEYQQIKRKLQCFQMREEELASLIDKKFQYEKERIISEGVKMQQNDEFIMVKISKESINDYGKQKKQKNNVRKQRKALTHSISMIEPTKKRQIKPVLQKIKEEKIETEKGALQHHMSEKEIQIQGNPFQKNRQSRISNINHQSQIEEQGENANFVYMVRRISPDSQLNSSIISSISSLRSMRKKIFDDDIWDQFEKI